MKITVDTRTACAYCPLLQGGGEPADGGEEMTCGADPEMREPSYDACTVGDHGEQRPLPELVPAARGAGNGGDGRAEVRVHTGGDAVGDTLQGRLEKETDDAQPT